MKSIIFALLVALVLLVGLFIWKGLPYLERKLNERQQQRDADRGQFLGQSLQPRKGPDGLDFLANHDRAGKGTDLRG